MIEIWHPRYRDKTVLIAANKIKDPLVFEITKSKKFKGTYKVAAEVVETAKHEKMETKSGYEMDMVVIPLDKLEKIDGKD